MKNLNIIFDLDGTLVHSAPDLHAAANVALAHVGRPILDLALVTSFVGDGVEKLVERCVAHSGDAPESVHSAALRAFLDSYGANMTTLTKPYPGVLACLQVLKAHGAILGVCTNKPTGPAREVCRALDLDRYFDVILGAEAGRPKKPNPQPLLECAERMGAEAGSVIYVGDSAVDYETAKNAGVPFRFFTGGYLNGPPLEVDDASKIDDWSHPGISDALLAE